MENYIIEDTLTWFSLISAIVVEWLMKLKKIISPFLEARFTYVMSPVSEQFTFKLFLDSLISIFDSNSDTWRLISA